MNKKLQAALGVCAIAAAAQASAAITLYEGEGFHGRAVTTNDRVWNFERFGFNDRASSVIVDRGAWEVCEDVRFEGRCVILRRGNYPSLRAVGLNNQISSARPYDRHDRRGRRHDDDDGPRAYAPPPAVAPMPVPVPAPQPVFRPQPAFYDVPVTTVRAVVGPPSQRCWIEREQVAQQPGGNPNIGGAVLGGLVGGLLGHQVGGGGGKDLATVGGVVAGAAIGANVNRGSGSETRDVQRCQTVTNAQPAYYDVTYWYRGVEHHAQTTVPPGATIRVDPEGVPVVAR